MNRSRTIVLGLVIILLVGLLAACGGEDKQQDPTAVDNQEVETVANAPDATAASDQEAGSADEPTAEPADDEATVASEPEATNDSKVDDDEKELSKSSENLVVGSASVEDDEDDVINLLMQEPDDPMPGIDLRRVQIDADGNQIVVTIETEGDIAAQLSDDDDVSFDVHLWQDDKPRYAMSFHHNGSDDWEATVTDFSEGLLGDEDTVDTAVNLDGNRLSAAFPLSMMPELESSFEWYSSVMLAEDGMTLNGWFDGAPENVIQLLADPDEFVEFPG
jgi:hypothetical protein